MMKLYLDEILSGQKTNDARLYPTEKRGTVALVDSSSFRVYGLAELVSVKEISYDDFVKWHQTGPFADTPIALYSKGKTCYSYELRNVRRLPVPVQLPKDPDARMWITVPEEKSKSFSYQKTLFRRGSGQSPIYNILQYKYRPSLSSRYVRRKQRLGFRNKMAHRRA